MKHDRNDVPCRKTVDRAGDDQRTCVHLVQLYQMRYLVRPANVMISSSPSSSKHRENIKHRQTH